jgi:hypothetical protein
MRLEFITNLWRWLQEKFGVGAPQDIPDFELHYWRDSSSNAPQNHSAWESPWEDPGEDKEWFDLEGPDLPSEW